jgi:hypothetical protein
MKIAYLILAHNNPAHLLRMIARLSTPDTLFYIHLDAKTDIEDFEVLRQNPSVVFCKKRVSCFWGDISLVDATLQMMETAAADARKSDYFVLLSGACYPIQSSAYIEDFFEKNRGSEFIEVFPFPNPAYGKPMERITNFWIKRSRSLSRVTWSLQRFLNKHFPPRRYQEVMRDSELVAGSQWWALSSPALHYVLKFKEENPRFYRFCRHVDCPDEFFFQSILWNSVFKKSIRHSLTYTNWKPGSTGPQNIGTEHLPHLSGQYVLDAPDNNCPNPKREVLFARKFPMGSDDVLDQIDDIVTEKTLVELLSA